MALAMTRPYKHKKTGVFWLRKRVPADLVPVLKRVEVTRTLATRDPADAKRRHLAVLSELEAEWARLRAETSATHASKPTTLTERQAHERAKCIYDYWL